jgi:very-short-patch-repair endonuclease
MSSEHIHFKLIQKIDFWKNNLADLGKKNPLIKFKSDNAKTLEILQDDLDWLLKTIYKEKKVFKFYIDNKNSRLSLRNTSNNQLITRQKGEEQLTKLNKLRLEAKRSLEELGVNSLFLVLGTLGWYDKDKPDDKLVSPLLLVPVNLDKESRKETYKLSVIEDEVIINPALSEKLKQTFGIDLPTQDDIQNLSCSKTIFRIQQAISEQQWEITENIFLSLFSYAKAALVRDITKNQERIIYHPILQAIGGDLTNYQVCYQEPRPANKLDFVKPELLFQILDADSSQQVVIEAAKAGSSFVVQGPPGTGKSQTIVNIIAELIGNGKSVLLVAEKQTALSVVYQRLAECGLEHLCLDLHHKGTTDKKQLIKELSKNISDLELQGDFEEHSYFFNELSSKRAKLNLYLKSLHEKEPPLNKSPFELFGKLLEFNRQQIPSINIIFSNFNDWNEKKLLETKTLLEQLAGYSDFFLEQTTTIWSDSKIDSYSYELQLKLKEKIADFQQAFKLVTEINQQIEKLLSIKTISNLELLEISERAISHILNIPCKFPDTLEQIDIVIAQSTYDCWKKDVKIIEELESDLTDKYSTKLFLPYLLELSDRYNKYSRFWFIRIFNIKYWRDRNYLNSLKTRNKKISHQQLKKDLTQAVRVQSIRNDIQKDDYPAQQVFGSLFNPQVSKLSDLEPIDRFLGWLIDLEQYQLPFNLVKEVTCSSSCRQQLIQLSERVKDSIDKIKQGLEFIFEYFDSEDIFDNNFQPQQIAFCELKDFLGTANSELSDFQNWLDYKNIYQNLESFGGAKFLEYLRQNILDSEYWYPVLEKRIYQMCLEAILCRKQELRSFKPEVHQRQIEEFVELDREQLEVARKRLSKHYHEYWQKQKQNETIKAELLNLNREENKKNRHLPIRKLLNDPQKGIPNLVQTLKPCWMMSPLSVSQYINVDTIHFDVLIFDEASQLKTEDVISSIIRADRVIVIGDKKQLPPTSFFASGDIDDEEEENVNYESFLDECSNFMFGRTLKWHYRSRDERLITFSNKRFYDSQLITFPNPVNNPNLGVWFEHVANGIYDRAGRRDNRLEAEKVARLTLELFKKNSNQSLGIIAFSEAQRNAIQEQLEILGNENSEFDIFCNDNSTLFFLKSLENVQGDEADIILLSVGYARDSEGKLSLNFGPINKQGGERRLNVAITRARSKIIVVSSIKASDIDISNSKSEGLKILRDYLKYAESGGDRLEDNSYSNKLKFDSPFEEDVYHALKDKDYIIRTQVGCSNYRIDLAVVDKNHPGQFLLGIECDGASYHSSPTARDRDRLRQQVLERLGWRIHRIWSTDWFRNKPDQIELVVKKIEKLQQLSK